MFFRLSWMEIGSQARCLFPRADYTQSLAVSPLPYLDCWLLCSATHEQAVHNTACLLTDVTCGLLLRILGKLTAASSVLPLGLLSLWSLQVWINGLELEPKAHRGRMVVAFNWRFSSLTRWKSKVYISPAVLHAAGRWWWQIPPSWARARVESPDDARNLGPSTEPPAHKRAGVACSTPGPQTRPSLSEREACACLVGQHFNSLPNKPPGHHQNTSLGDWRLNPAVVQMAWEMFSKARVSLRRLNPLPVVVFADQPAGPECASPSLLGKPLWCHSPSGPLLCRCLHRICLSSKKML